MNLGSLTSRGELGRDKRPVGLATRRKMAGLLFLSALGITGLGMVTGCRSNEGVYDSGLRADRLKRTSLDGWQVREFPLTGLVVEIPVDAYYASDDVYGADIGLHPVKQPRMVVGDTRPLLKISMERIDQEDLLKRRSDIRKSDSYVNGDDQTRAFWEWVVARHQEIERYDKEGYTYFRYELECPDGSFIRSKAELVNVQIDGVAIYEEEDEKAIRRILESASCIERSKLSKPLERLAG